MMDEYQFKEAIDLVNPFQKVIYYFIVGFIVSTIQFDIGFLPIFSTLVSILCFYLGLRMVRKENKAFFWAYVLTIVLMILSVFQALVIATSLYYSSMFDIACFGIKFLQILLICFGLKNCIPTHPYPFYMFISYTLLLYAFWLGESELSGILFIIGFISLLYWLIECQKYLMSYQYQLSLSPIKISEKGMWISYIGITTVLALTITISFPFFNYQYTDRNLPEYQYELLDTVERHNSDSLIQNEKSQASIYEYDQDHYLYVYHFQFQDIHQLMTALIISIEQKQGNTDQRVEDIYVSDSEKNYIIQEEEEISHRLPSMFNHFGAGNDYYVVDVNPLVNDLDVSIMIKVNKGETFTESCYDFTFFFQNGMTYPYSRNSGSYIVRGYNSLNGKWGYEQFESW